MDFLFFNKNNLFSIYTNIYIIIMIFIEIGGEKF